MPAGYNAPARIEVQRDKGWAGYATASFLYWQAIQENMELGIVVPDGTLSELFVTDAISPSSPGKMLNMDFDFKPGFKVGVGSSFSYDGWDVFAEYTRYHGTNEKHFHPASSVKAILPLGINPDIIRISTAGIFNQAKEGWHLKMDFADLTLGRFFYVGKQLIVRPSLGVRGAWIRQQETLAFTNTNALFAAGGAALGTVKGFKSSVSQGVGPSLGLISQWKLGQGFSLGGTAWFDLLYTRYSMRTAETFSSFTDPTTNLQMQFSQAKDGVLRPHAMLELGLGWGSYFAQRKWHTDISLNYGFQAFWDQNVFRYFTNSQFPQFSCLPNGDLFVQGLNATIRFDF